MPPNYSSAFAIEVDTPPRRLSIGEIAVGSCAFEEVTITPEMLAGFGRMAQDRAAVHNDPRFAQKAGYDRPIVQGLAVASRFSRLLGMYLPGEHAVLEKIALTYRRPVFLGDKVIYSAAVTRIARALKIVRLDLFGKVNDEIRVQGDAQCVLR